MFQNDTRWTKELEKITAIIYKTNLTQTIKWGAEVFTHNDKNVISYGGFKNFFAIWFFNGVFINDKYNVLIAASDGKTKSLRQWRFNSHEEIEENKILEYIADAIRVEDMGLKIKPEKFSQLPTPEILENVFISYNSLSLAFKNLSRGKQNEYIIYLNEPKQESTKFKRLEKITPLILNGVGLNDKYK